MVDLKIEKTKSENWRYGTPIDEQSLKTLAILKMNEQITLEKVITHPQFFLLSTILHEADIENINKLKNPETPFLIKYLENQTNLIKQTPRIPFTFLPQLDQATSKLLESIYQLKKRSEQGKGL